MRVFTTTITYGCGHAYPLRTVDRGPEPRSLETACAACKRAAAKKYGEELFEDLLAGPRTAT